jgi:hypothetical protein
VALGFSLAIAPHAKAGFVGYYDVNSGNWVLSNSTGADPFTDGTAVTLDSGLSLTLTGGNDGSGFGGITTFLIAAASAGTVQFDWSYTSQDSNVPACVAPDFNTVCDTAFYQVAGTQTYLADDTSSTLSGTVAPFVVTAGEMFGFEVDTADNSGGPGILTISNFSAPDVSLVPEPDTALLFLVGLLLTAGAHRWRQRSSK